MYFPLACDAIYEMQTLYISAVNAFENKTRPKPRKWLDNVVVR